MNAKRNFDVLSVGRPCGVQLAESRFGPDVRDDIRTMLQEPWGAGDDPDDEDDNFEGAEDEGEDELEGLGGVFGMDLGVGFAMDVDAASMSSEEESSFPHMARLRLNLTALSQRYNLYFVAYREEIHVFQPQRAPGVIGQPDLILQPRPSKAASMVGGHLDRMRPHQFNHLIVGELGDQEILVGATDDGDVIAYFTSRIASHIERRSSKNDPVSCVRRDLNRGIPNSFFHENIGISAWGLAIHKISRLIAVSSNHHEVTVFALALKDPKQDDVSDRTKPPDPQATGEKKFKAHVQDVLDRDYCKSFDPVYFYPVDTATGFEVSGWMLQKHFTSRTRNWRIVLALPREAQNLPNISFCDDLSGHADMVAAVDISGNLWMVDIWKIASRPVRILPNQRLDSGVLPGHQTVRGWAVMPLYPRHFKPTKSVMEALGTQYEIGEVFTKPGGVLDISQTLAEVVDNAAHHQSVRRFQNLASSQQPGVVSVIGIEDGSEEQPRLNTPPFHFDPPTSSYQLEPPDSPWKEVNPSHPTITDIDSEFHLAMTMVPATAQHYAEFTLEEQIKFTSSEAARERNRDIQFMNLKEAKINWRFHPGILDNISLIRTNETDVELINLNPAHPDVLCRNVVEQVHRHNETPPWDLHFGQRLSMLMHVPELSLVIIGSMCGRVALVTLTQCPFGQRMFVGGRAFRVEHLLPRMSEDAGHKKLRPYCCLLGIAISPIPESRRKGLNLRQSESTPVRRWRLILHYMDHTILMYDITRPGDLDMDLIF